MISWKHILYIPLCKKCDQLEAHCVHTTLQKCYQLEAHLVHSILQKVLLAGSTLCTYHSAKSVISWKHTLYIPLCKKCYQLEAHFVHFTLQKVLLSQVRRATCYTHHTHQFNLYVLQDNYPLFQARQATCYTHHLLFQARIATC